MSTTKQSSTTKHERPSTALEVTKVAAAVVTPARPQAMAPRETATTAVSLPLGRGLMTRARTEWLPVAAWKVGRTGRPGFLGLALLLASAIFLVSTHLDVASDVEALRAQAALAPAQRSVAIVEDQAGQAPGTPVFAPRSTLPATLHQIFDQAALARLSVDTARYEISAVKGTGVFRYRLSFPVTGPYPQVRAFIDSVLATMPAVALTDLTLERKTIGSANVEAQIRLTVYTGSDP